jgi:hypothetical protein
MGSCPYHAELQSLGRCVKPGRSCGPPQNLTRGVTRLLIYYLGEDRGNAEAFAHMAIDTGASLVIASGPHVLRGMQFYKRHLIAYSVGNFASYGDFSTEGDLDMSVILHVTLSQAGRFEHAGIYPIRFTGEGRPVPGGGAIAFAAKLASEDFGSSAARILPSGVITPP